MVTGVESENVLLGGVTIGKLWLTLISAAGGGGWTGAGTCSMALRQLEKGRQQERWKQNRHGGGPDEIKRAPITETKKASAKSRKINACR